MRRKRKRQEQLTSNMTATCDECNQDSRASPPPQRVPPTVIQVCFVALLILSALLGESRAQLDYQISAQVGESARLPCSIGNPAFCGLPYLVAWYKLNSNSWQRVSPRAKHSSHQSSCELPAQPNSATLPAPAPLASRQHQFKCTFIGLNPVELADEGQYKCEVTYRDALDSDRCPPATVSQFNVVALPSEPEIILNGKPIADTNKLVSLKEGSQVRMECQSWGGKPAPRIEWLNVSESRSGEPEVMLLQSRWSQKKSSNNNNNQVTPIAAGLQPLSSAAVSVALSRHDLNVRFACLVQVAGVGPLEQPLEQLVGPIPPPGTMLRWIKLDVQVKPSGVQLGVFQLDSGRQPQVQPLAPNQEESVQVYSLQPNRLYAIQCQVAHSRPRSQVGWFNRSAPVQLEPVELESELGELASLSEHQQRRPEAGKLSSFVRTISHPDGTFSTLATLLLRTSLWDGPEELICRPSNEAFELEDLIQVAPIVTARLSVNYPPVALLEPASDEENSQLDSSGQLRLTEGRPLVLRCTVAANPIGHNTILQIDWTYQGRKLGSATSSRSATVGQQAAARSPVIERPNHLHMPQGPSSRLLHTSQLSILSARISDSGSYGCHFKLIPAPSGQSAPPTSSAPGASSQAPPSQPSPPLRITSGQANRTIQVHVIEATSGSPTLRVRTGDAEAGLLMVYGRRGVRHLTAVLSTTTNSGHNNLSVSLWCDTGAITNGPHDPQTVQRIVWYHNGVQLHSDAHTDTYNLSLEPEVGPAATSSGRRLGTYSCAQQYVQGPTSAFQASQLRFQASRNQVELRMRAGPRLLIERRELMPASRGFTRLELLSRPEGRLKLACSAHCEPLCSIDWLIDGRLIERPPTWPTANEDGNRVRVPMAAASEDELVVEPLFWFETFTSRQNESIGAAWRRTSSLLVAPMEAAGLSVALGEGGQPGNVHSRLELSYRQIAQLFGLTSSGGHPVSRSHQLPIKCRINGSEPFSAGPGFGGALVKPGNWFPPKQQPDVARDDENELISDLMLEQAPANLNLTSKSPPIISDDYWGPQYSTGTSWRWGNTQWTPKEVGLATSGTPDEMQISLLLDGPPSQVSLAFSGPLSTSGSGASLTESQLLELLNPGQRAPTLTCTGLSQPRARFRWTFVDLNKTEHQLASDSAQLSLRQLLEWSRHKMGADYGNQVASIGLALVSGLVGNYTCTAWNEFGSSSDSLVLGFQGRPICNLSVVESESKLRCSVYSDPQLLETVWFKDNQQVALNRSSLGSSSPLLEAPQAGSISRSPLWSIDLPLRQASDETRSSNFRCIARNPLGYSATCELGFPLERSVAQQSDTASRQTPPMSMITIPDVKHIDVGPPIRLADQPNVSSIFQQVAEPALGSQSQSQSQSLAGDSAGDRVLALLRVFLAKIDWLLLACCLLTVSWLLFLLGSSFLKRRFGGLHLPVGKQQHQHPPDNHHTSWSFTTRPHAGFSSAGGAGQLPVLAGPRDTRPFLKPCPINYYGSSNADSERDMVQSCSQSSHYDVDYGVTGPAVASTTCASQTHQFPHQRPQPLYFNAGHPTSTTMQLRRTNATMKQSMSSSTMIMGPEQLEALRAVEGTQKRHPPTAGNKPASNVPLINGTLNSRIDLDQPQPQQQPAKYSSNQLQNQFGLQARDQQPRGEHIYDRVIYGQMIL